MTPELKRRGRSRQQVRAERSLARHEMALARAVREAKNAFVAECASSAEIGDRNFDGEKIAHRVAVRYLLIGQFEQVIPAFGRVVLNDIEALTRKASVSGVEIKADDSFFARLIERWTRERIKDAAEQIADTSMADVLAAVGDGISLGLGSTEIAKRIRTVTKLSKHRAFTVARTETHMAASFAQAGTASQAETEFGIKLVKVWLPTLDGRTRDTHAAMASHPPIPLTDKFNVGGVPMDRPGDPAGGVANCVNCRCSMAHRLAED